MINLFHWGRPKPEVLIGQSLYAQCVDQSRKLLFYTDFVVPDEIGARFELLIVHIIPVLESLKAGGEREQAIAQSVFDAFLRALDDSLREQGVGDLTVPKKMKPLISIIYSRIKQWNDLIQLDEDQQKNYLVETIYARRDDEPLTRVEDNVLSGFVEYLSEVRQYCATRAFLHDRIEWPVPQITKLTSEA